MQPSAMIWAVTRNFLHDSHRCRKSAALIESRSQSLVAAQTFAMAQVLHAWEHLIDVVSFGP